MNTVSYTSIVNKEAGSSVRAKINTLGSNVVTMSNEVKSELDALNTYTGIVETRLDALEEVQGLLVLGTTNALTAQTVSTTPSKLFWFENQNVKRGTSLSSNIPNNTVTVNTTDVYTVSGTILLRAGNGDEVKIEMYVNGNPTGALSIVVGRGNTKDVSFNYSGAASLNAGDVVALYITSTGTPITITHSSFVMQQIK